jgi:hypothetical protein
MRDRDRGRDVTFISLLPGGLRESISLLSVLLVLLLLLSLLLQLISVLISLKSISFGAYWIANFSKIGQ